ncbi:hypothetical protein AVEN_161153-1, partial [Araneus ventricosus]
KVLETAKMSQRSDLLKWRRNRAAAQRQISEGEKKERAKQLQKERTKRYYEKNNQKKNFITQRVTPSHRATLVT